MPDATWGETVAAFVVLRDGARRIGAGPVGTRRGAARGVQATPRWVVVEALPRNAMGKVQRDVLRAGLH